MAKVLFVAYGGGHVAMVIPTIRELQRRGGWEISVLGLTTATSKLKEAGIPSLGFRDLVEPGDERALEHGRRLSAGNHTSGLGIAEEETIAYLGLSYADLEDRVGVEEAARQYAKRQRHAFLPVGPLRRLILRERPDLVVVTSAPRAERAAVIAAEELGIPTIFILDFFGGEWDFLYDPHYAGRMFAITESVRDEFVGLGRPARDVIVTGNPAFDRLAEPKYAEAGARWRVEQRLDERKIILWADTVMLSDEHRQRVLDRLADSTQRHPDWQFVYRPHPSMSRDGIRLPPHFLLADNRTELAVQLHAADCVLVTISTSGLEAALIGKPVVKMRFADPACDMYTPYYAKLDALAPYETIGFAVPASDLEAIESAIESALPGGANSEALAAGRGRLPAVGQAAANVATGIENYLRESQARRLARAS